MARDWSAALVKSEQKGTCKPTSSTDTVEDSGEPSLHRQQTMIPSVAVRGHRTCLPSVKVLPTLAEQRIALHFL